MSLVRLLTTGKSLVGKKDLETRYNVTTQRLLPKFGSPKNPFQPAAVRAEAPYPRTALPAKAVPAPQPASPESAPAALAPAAPPPASPNAEPSATLDRTQGQAVPAPAPARSWFGAALARLTGWLRGSNRRGKQTPSAIPQFNKLPMQTELRLDAIKPVRNDLSDSDLEVVSAQPSATLAPATAPSKPEAKAAGRRKTWNRVSSRLFSAGKTLR